MALPTGSQQTLAVTLAAIESPCTPISPSPMATESSELILLYVDENGRVCSRTLISSSQSDNYKPIPHLLAKFHLENADRQLTDHNGPSKLLIRAAEVFLAPEPTCDQHHNVPNERYKEAAKVMLKLLGHTLNQAFGAEDPTAPDHHDTLESAVKKLRKSDLFTAVLRLMREFALASSEAGDVDL